MKRREILAYFGAAATQPASAFAQQPGRVYRIGVMVPTSMLQRADEVIE